MSRRTGIRTALAYALVVCAFLPEKSAAAGGPAVVASLRYVYTWSTTDLMVNFYAGLRQTDRGIAGALKEARLALLKDRDNGRYAHPYYWAPFLVFGDWR